MRQEHLTPDGWKPCTATTKECKYEKRRIADASTFIDSAVEAVQAGKPNAVRSFFNSLFGSAKNTVEVAAPVITPAAVTKPLELNKVVKGEDGQYQVLCTGTWDKEPLIHKFGDLIKDKATAERLHNADPKKDYQLGECGVIAGELWNRNENVREYYIMKTDSDPIFGTHHFVQLKDGTYADSLGIWTEGAFLAHWKALDPSCEIATFDVEEEPESRNPNFTISNLELFNTVNELIEKHMSGQSL
jgi:hypothetical protein